MAARVDVKQRGAGVYVGSTARVPRVVVLAELPRTRATLLLRLMGRDRVLREALADFHALPADAWERGFVPRLLLQVRDDLHRMGADAPESEELRMRYAEIVENTDRMLANARAEGERRGEVRGEARGEARGVARGEAQGRAEALRDAVLAMCEVLDITVDEARREVIARADGEALAAMLDALRHTRALP